MRRKGRVAGALGMVMAIFLFVASCTKPPAQEIIGAEQALENARAKEADIYLEDSYRKAEADLKKAKDLMAQKEYRGAKAAAEGALTQAQLLASQVDAAKNKMKTDADQVLQQLKEQTNELKMMVAEAIKRKIPVNREEAESLIGKNEIDLINVKVRLETGKVRQGYDDLKIIKSQTAAEKEKLLASLSPGSGTK